MAKYARVYFSTFIDIEVVEENFSNQEEMIEWANENAYTELNYQEMVDNACVNECETEIIEL